MTIYTDGILYKRGFAERTSKLELEQFLQSPDAKAVDAIPFIILLDKRDHRTFLHSLCSDQCFFVRCYSHLENLISE